MDAACARLGISACTSRIPVTTSMPLRTGEPQSGATARHINACASPGPRKANQLAAVGCSRSFPMRLVWSVYGPVVAGCRFPQPLPPAASVAEKVMFVFAVVVLVYHVSPADPSAVE